MMTLLGWHDVVLLMQVVSQVVVRLHGIGFREVGWPLGCCEVASSLLSMPVLLNPKHYGQGLVEWLTEVLLAYSKVLEKCIEKFPRGFAEEFFDRLMEG